MQYGTIGSTPNSPGMGHLNSLAAYLEVCWDHTKGFIDIRYWELDQSLDEVLLRQISLNLHLELLHALKEVLAAPERLKDTVSMRVERAVKRAMTRESRQFRRLREGIGGKFLHRVVDDCSGFARFPRGHRHGVQRRTGNWRGLFRGVHYKGAPRAPKFDGPGCGVLR